MRFSDARSRMWAEAVDMLREAERLQRQFFQVGVRPRPQWEPPVDVFEADGETWLYFALPGVAGERVQVAVEGHELVVRGERPLPAHSRAANIRQLEIPYGPFERRLAFAAGHYELIEQRFDHGCLVVGLRRAA